MAAPPLFVVGGLTELKNKIRLGDLPSAAPANAILDQAVVDARLEFYRRLGVDRVAAILAYPYSATPSTLEQVLRSVAESTEIIMVRCFLLRRLPVTFMDASGDVNERWNEEAPVRELEGQDRLEEIQRCEAEIERNMALLEGGSVGSECHIQTWDGTPDVEPPKPGDSLRKWRW